MIYLAPAFQERGPDIVLILAVNRTIQDYAGLNAGGNMEETMQSIGNQVKASLHSSRPAGKKFLGYPGLLEDGPVL